MRFQELMPDVLHWLGISKIDRFVSMSNMKHDAVVRAGIQIVERVPIPDELIPLDARVEMDAKMGRRLLHRRRGARRQRAGQSQRPRYRWLRRPKQRRERRSNTTTCRRRPQSARRTGTIFEAARRGTLAHFRLNEGAVAGRRGPRHRRHPRGLSGYSCDSVPRSLPGISTSAGSLDWRASNAASKASTSTIGCAPRTELVITSVLLDAGAGTAWQYREPDGRSFSRSEGLAVASYHLFMSGALASDHSTSADGAGLLAFDAAHLNERLSSHRKQSADWRRRSRGAAAQAGRGRANDARVLRLRTAALGRLGCWPEAQSGRQ